jgi:hypothetical protein
VQNFERRKTKRMDEMVEMQRWAADSSVAKSKMPKIKWP